MKIPKLLILGSMFLITVSANAASFLSSLHRIMKVASTVPEDGDVNPYGVAVVPTTTGALVANSVLVSNFNNSANLQGITRPVF